MTPYEQLRNARHDIWRNLPNRPTTFSRCECDRGNGRGGGPCIKCAEDALAKLVGEVEAAAYVATVRRVRDLERGHEMLLENVKIPHAEEPAPEGRIDKGVGSGPWLGVCGECVHFIPHRDPTTNRVHPSKAGRCGWKMPKVVWPMAFLRAGYGYGHEEDPRPPYAVSVWKDTNAKTCQCFSPNTPGVPHRG